MASSADPDVTGCPQEYAKIPVCALWESTRLKLAEILDKNGKLVKVEIDNVPTEILNDVTGLAKLSSREDCLYPVDLENQLKRRTLTLLRRWTVDGVTIGKFWEYLLILQRHDVIQDCRQSIMSDCQIYFDQTKMTAMAKNRTADKKKNGDLKFSSMGNNNTSAVAIPPPERKSKFAAISKIFKPWKWKRKKKTSEKIEKTAKDLSASDDGPSTPDQRDWPMRPMQISKTIQINRYSTQKCMPYRPKDDNDSSKIFEYDAFVCHNQDDPEDMRFVQDLIEELEGRRGLRLYVPGRDGLSGASECINDDDKIVESCRRVITVLSGSFLQSRFCVFIEGFAQELSTDERRARMIAVLRERGTVVPYTLNDSNTLDYNDMNEINWVLLTSSILAPITQRTYMEFKLNRSFPPRPRRNGSSNPSATENTRAQRREGASENTTPKVVNADNTTPKVVITSPLTVSTSPATVSSEIRTDLQILQKERHILQEGGERTLPAPITNIETSLLHEDETRPNHELLDEHIDSMSSEHVEYHQPATGMQKEHNTCDTLLSQNPIPTEPDEQTNSRTPQLLAEQTSSMTLSEQLISEPSTNDQRIASVNPQEHIEKNNK